MVLGGIELAIRSRAMPGQVDSGDAGLALPAPGGVLLLVVDGLGHGTAAADAARLALAVVERHGRESLEAIFKRCHEALRSGRGVAMSAALVTPALGTLTWAGVGNVEGLVAKPDPGSQPGWKRQRLITRAGVVGYALPPIRPASIDFSPGSYLLFATDGLEHDFGDEVVPGLAAGELAGRALERHWRGSDDGLVLVAQHQEAA